MLFHNNRPQNIFHFQERKKKKYLTLIHSYYKGCNAFIWGSDGKGKCVQWTSYTCYVTYVVTYEHGKLEFQDDDAMNINSSNKLSSEDQMLFQSIINECKFAFSSHEFVLLQL